MKYSLVFAIVGFFIIISLGFLELKYLLDLTEELISSVDKIEISESLVEQQKEIADFRDKWDKNKNILSMFIDHQDIHKIETVLAEVETILKNNSKKSQISTNFALLKLYIEDIAEERTFILQNIL